MPGHPSRHPEGHRRCGRGHQADATPVSTKEQIANVAPFPPATPRSARRSPRPWMPWARTAHLRRGEPDVRHRHGHRRGHAVRARLHLAVHGHRHGEDGGRPQRSLHPPHRPEGHQHPGHGAPAGGDHEVRSSAVHRCRGRRGRSAGHHPAEQAARHVQLRRHQAPGFGDRRKRILEDIAAAVTARRSSTRTSA